MGSRHGIKGPAMNADHVFYLCRVSRCDSLSFTGNFIKRPIMPRIILIPIVALLISGCGDHAHTAGDGHDHGAALTATPDEDVGHEHAGHDHAGHSHGGDGITLTATVRENLGITFAKAEYRVVQGILRVPGRFESESSAHRAYQVPLAGRVEVLVKPYQRVVIGEPLYRIASVAWNTLQRELAESAAAVDIAAERYLAAQAHIQAIDQAASIWRERVTTLERLAKEIGGKAIELAEASGRVADLQVQQTEARTRLVEMKREVQGADASPDSGLAAIRLRNLLTMASHITGLDVATLSADNGGRPHWQTIKEPVVFALASGVVEGEIVTSGTWLDARGTVLTITDPAGVRLRASALQSDLSKLSDGLAARIVGVDPHDTLRLDADIVLAPLADARDRSVEVIARPRAGTTVRAGIRPGVVAALEIVVAGSADEELAIPLAATIRDGLKTIFFKRSRTNPDVVEKGEADVGANDGRWVVVNSGVKEGDEVVVGGIYPLKLSQQEGGGAQAGHFEADGTFHTGKH